MNSPILILRSALKWMMGSTWPAARAQTIVEWATAEAELLPKYDLSRVADLSGKRSAAFKLEEEEDGEDDEYYDWRTFRRLESLLVDDLDFRRRLGQMVAWADEEYGGMKATEEGGEPVEKAKTWDEVMDITDMSGMMMEEVEVEKVVLKEVASTDVEVEEDTTPGDITGQPRKLA
ncbi:uncharacterized protein DNG_01824 [Cephalotrichum gorgonifer]|uniref:Uncharacterized protein n=1 Tax=Cephalotrichum gorgonifer TaxID=2041049 RepID=A0AAE8SS54_9PEZI|nr:uncharacterized protein DNG_01824 [Cephalotrichum gorgonifer]